MIGKNIRRLRQEMGLSQTALAQELRVTQGAVSQWEKETSYPDTSQLIAISEFFQVTLDDLLHEDTILIRAKMKKDGDRLSEVEMRLVVDFRSLSSEGKERVLDYVGAMCVIYKKPSIPSRLEEPVR